MKIAIIGSRSRATQVDKKLVFDIVFNAVQVYGFEELWLVSGGCPDGADNFAEEAAKYFGVSIVIHYPQKLPKSPAYHESVKRFYRRNDKIARDCDVIYSLVSSKRDGGAEYTLKKAKGLRKVCYAVLPDGQHILESTSDS